MKASASGILRHCFFGDYFAVVGLAFASPEAARDALATLGAPWVVSDTQPHVLGAKLDSIALLEFKSRFAPSVPECTHRSYKRRRKADRIHDIDSIAHSVDVGPRFTVEIPTVPAEQLGLFEVAS